MDPIECVLGLRNVRNFMKKPVDMKLIETVLNIAIHAPSAGNTQEWGFFVVTDEKQRERLSIAALQQNFVKEAPVVIVVCADIEKVKLKYKDRGEKLYSIQDTAYVSLSIAIVAHALGLGSSIVPAFDNEHVKEILELPEYLRPMTIIPIGYAADVAEPTDRIPFENLTYINKYGTRYIPKGKKTILL